MIELKQKSNVNQDVDTLKAQKLKLMKEILLLTKTRNNLKQEVGELEVEKQEIQIEKLEREYDGNDMYNRIG